MPGGKICSVAICRHNSKKLKELSKGKHVNFFSFPKDPKICKEWIRRCYRGDKFSVKNKRICSKHFTVDDYEDGIKAKIMDTFPKKLKATAIPSLYLLPSTEQGTSKTSEHTKRAERKNKKTILQNLLEKSSTETKSDYQQIEQSGLEQVSLNTQSPSDKSNFDTKIKALQLENDNLKIELEEIEVDRSALKSRVVKLEQEVEEWNS